MTVSENYKRWLELATDDADITAELQEIDGKENEIYERFYRELEFGTAGLRGVIGAGDNRMNIYTIRKATQGLAEYLNSRYPAPCVAIGYDSRIKSDVFAKETARVLAGNGIAVKLFAELVPVPVLSFAVKHLVCQAGVMVTASHNPAIYNGYKCYGADGYQMTDDDAATVTECIRRLDMFTDIRLADFDTAVADGRITLVDDVVMGTYLNCVTAQQINAGVCRDSDIHVIYSPLNGAGNKPVRAVLERIGLLGVSVVPEQELPDGNFPTAPFPNPELRETFNLALEMAKDNPADLLLATDPDCDRVGIAVREGDEYTLLTGNETGCLLLNYILSCRAEQGTLPENPVVIKTIVTSNLAARIAEKYGCELRNVLTGFKYIGEQIVELEKAETPERFLFGFEESYGCLVGTHARDKDAVVASMLICEMTAYYASKGLNLCQVLNALYEEHGVYRHRLVNVQFEGAEGMAAMEKLMAKLRKKPPVELAGLKVLAVADYLSSERTGADGCQVIDLPKSNVLTFELENHAEVIVRPSGTEPKVKGYVTATGNTIAEADAVIAELLAVTEKLIKGSPCRKRTCKKK
ncbi:MAG: phospho-sugar mutase [Clostridia bacterium]|nr:phospho-sugar mutase [Clostridia bacterium]